MATLTIKLPTGLKVRLEAEARLAGKSVSAVVRESILKNTSRHGRRKPSLYERTKDLCGAGKSGIPDLATNPAHLKGLGSWRG